MTVSLDGSPYSLEGQLGFQQGQRTPGPGRPAQGTGTTLRTDLTGLLRGRFRQIAESNAIEGSTLDVGETMAAQGDHHHWTRSGLFGGRHQPLEGAGEDGRTRPRWVTYEPRPGEGAPRSDPGPIAGSGPLPYPAGKDRGVAAPPSRLLERDNVRHGGLGRLVRVQQDGQALLRAIVLKTWLTHIHPFVDGNGRTSRAVMNLELIRAEHHHPP